MPLSDGAILGGILGVVVLVVVLLLAFLPSKSSFTGSSEGKEGFNDPNPFGAVNSPLYLKVVIGAVAVIGGLFVIAFFADRIKALVKKN